MIPDIKEGFEASRGEEELLVFQTNCLSEYVNSRQPEDAELSKGNGNEDKKKLQVAVADFNEYSHGPKDIKEKTRSLLLQQDGCRKRMKKWTARDIHIMSTEVQQQVCNNTMDQQKAVLDIEIDELWKLMMKKSRWGYHEMRSAVSHKLQLVERDYVSKVTGKKQSQIWDPRKSQVEMRQAGQPTV
jgi:hypothetical protein